MLPRTSTVAPASRTWSLAIYDLAVRVVVPLTMPLLALHPRLRGGLGQRFGRWPRGSFGGETGPQWGAGPIWLHGSSAGDMAALLPLSRHLPPPVVLSCWTRSGQELVQRRLGPGAPIYRAPLDVGSTVRHVLDRLQPRLLVLECLELWPNLVLTCASRGVRVAVVNGRLSARSLRRYLWADGLFRPAFAALSLVTALTTQDALRFARAGVPEQRIVVETSSKHSVERLAGDPSAGRRLVLGSIHRAEEALLLDPVPSLLQRFPDLELVVAPRYPHRAASIHRRLARLGVSCQLLSASGGVEERSGVTIVDSMGALADEYDGATVAFVGGSLVDRGGHNPVEPAGRGVPVLIGPHVSHCAREVEMLREGGGAKLVQVDSVYREVMRLLDDTTTARQMGQRARSVAEQLAGAAPRIARRLSDLADPAC